MNEKKDIIVPPMGESIMEATVARWLKKEGDAVQLDEALVELETEKVTLEVNAPMAGILSEVRVPEGTHVEVGAILGQVTEKVVPAKETAAPPLSKDPLLTPDAQKHVAQATQDKAGLTERVPLSRLRLSIAARLKEAQNTAAILTTFNEVDMTTIMALRAEFKESFEKKYGVKLGFMSFFIKACVAALKEFPSVNAEIDGNDLIYKNYYDIGVAVGLPQGLVVPVVRDVAHKSFAEIEQSILDLSQKARDGKLTMEELQGGTFTISNGGVYGSLLSTPIINPPQSGILGMHKIQERPVAINGRVEIRPMMYLALSYDHRLIDGREAVTFLVRVKEWLESPDRSLLEM